MICQGVERSLVLNTFLCFKDLSFSSSSTCFLDMIYWVIMCTKIFYQIWNDMYCIIKDCPSCHFILRIKLWNSANITNFFFTMPFCLIKSDQSFIFFILNVVKILEMLSRLILAICYYNYHFQSISLLHNWCHRWTTCFWWQCIQIVG